MEECKRIENILQKSGIKEYNLVRCQEQEIQFSDYYGIIRTNICEEDKINVWFQEGKHGGNFTISVGQTDEIIKKMIDDSRKLAIANGEERNWLQNIQKSGKTNPKDGDFDFEEIDLIKNFMWVRKLIKKIKNTTDFDFNTSFLTKYGKYTLKNRYTYITQYKRNSEILCVENSRFEKKARMYNVFPGDNIENIIVKKLTNDKKYISADNTNKIKKVIISSKAMGQILNKYVLAFYADSIFFGQSFITCYILGKRILRRNINIDVLPETNICFDGEGNSLKEAPLVENGILKNFIGNNRFSYYLNIINLGYSDLSRPEHIKHQRIKFGTDRYKADQAKELDYIICEFENLYFDCSNGKLIATAKCQSKHSFFKIDINININSLLDHVYQASIQKRWNDNVYCSDMIWENIE